MTPAYRVTQKSKPQLLILIKPVFKPAIMARFFINFDYKWVKKYNKSVLNILRVT